MYFLRSPIIDIWAPGISHAYGGALSALSIHYTLTPVSSEYPESVWTEAEEVTAIYEDGEEVLVRLERIIEGGFAAL